MSGVLLSHPLPYSPGTGSLTDPEVRLIPASSSGPPVSALNSDYTMASLHDYSGGNNGGSFGNLKTSCQPSVNARKSGYFYISGFNLIKLIFKKYYIYMGVLPCTGGGQKRA